MTYTVRTGRGRDTATVGTFATLAAAAAYAAPYGPAVWVESVSGTVPARTVATVATAVTLRDRIRAAREMAR